MANKKTIFHKPTANEITRGKECVAAENNLIDIVLNLNPDKEVLVIELGLIPEEFFYVRRDKTGQRLTRTEANRKFMKHGDEVTFPRYRNSSEAISRMKGQGIVPADVRKDVFDSAKNGFYCGYSFVPLLGNDKRKRKVPLIEVLEGAKLYAYASRQGMPIEVTSYGDAGRVGIDGGKADVVVPSRTPKKGRYEFSIFGIPVRNSDLKYAIANCIASNHNCPDMQHRKRYKYSGEKENSRVFNWDAHDIAGFYAVIEHYYKGGYNLIPLAMSQIPLVSQLFVDIYERLKHNTVMLTREKEGQEPMMYPLNNAELEILVEGAVKRLGHQETLFCDFKKDGRLRDYKWRWM